VFARAAATFESEYVFCWLDWDGDNVLADGGIVDYGSVRQFGLYHREYRFDDADRWSTTIPEQRVKARYIAQCFAQIRAYLLEGRKRPLEDFAHDPCLRLFDREFAAQKERLLVRKLGLRPRTAGFLLSTRRRELERFRRAFSYFERARSARGRQKVPDGLTWNAVFSMRDLLRELPHRYAASPVPLAGRELLRIGLSSYAARADRAATPTRLRMAGRFQRSYLRLLRAAAAFESRPLAELLREVARRSAVINRRDRITGDGVDYATDRLIRYRRRLSSGKLHRVIAAFVDHQDLNPPEPAADREPAERPPAHDVRRVLDRLIDAVAEMRHGL
jgi:hypothetical protein